MSSQSRRIVRAGAAFATLAMLGLLAALRLGFVGPLPAGSPEDLVPVLLAAGLLCIVALAHRRFHPTAAWLATIGAAATVTVDLATYARTVRPFVDDTAWQWLAIAVSFAAGIAVAAATAYGVSRPRLAGGRYASEATFVATLGLAGLAVWAITNPTAAPFGIGASSPLGSLGVVTRSFLATTAIFTALGVLGDALPPAERAWRRVGLTHRGPASRYGRLRAWLPAFVDELSVGRAHVRNAVLGERSRIAADIHADVVPGLRRALADAEAGGDPKQLAWLLRQLLADVEAIGGERHAIQLDIGGLVPALAWIAERIERTSTLSITIDVADPQPRVEGSPPPDVAAAAFRVAVLALSNVAWHAPGSDAVIDVRVEADAIDMAIRDKGPGITGEAIASARESGKRGIADMAAEAAACRATLEIGPGPGEIGTEVRFTWRAPGGESDR